MPTFRLQTASREEVDPTPERIAEALTSVDRSGDETAFVVVTRDDGAFVQLKPEGPLEVGGTGPMPHRLDHAELARRIVERLARREDPWGGLPHWDLAPGEEHRRRGRRRDRIGVAILFLVLSAAIAGAYVLDW
jgi:hypothetical protein